MYFLNYATDLVLNFGSALMVAEREAVMRSLLQIMLGVVGE